MEQNRIPDQHDPLRNRFTAWLDKLIQRARWNYLEEIDDKLKIVPFDETVENTLIWEDNYDLSSDRLQDELEFEEERLAEALRALPLMRKRILIIADRGKWPSQATLITEAACISFSVSSSVSM